MPTGRVTAFDADRGLGEVTDADGRVWPFHCVEIADGSRTIAVGTVVEFEGRRKLGHHEAAALAPSPQRSDEVDTHTVDLD